MVSFCGEEGPACSHANLCLHGQRRLGHAICGLDHLLFNSVHCAHAHAHSRVNRRRPIRGFIPAETLVLNGSAVVFCTAGGTSNQPVLDFRIG